MTYATNLLALNAIAIDAGGSGGHATVLEALNEIATLNGAAGGHLYNLSALNAIDTALGGTGDHLMNLDAINSICVLVGGSGGHTDNLAGWTEIQGFGFGSPDGSPTALLFSDNLNTSCALSWTIGSTNHDGHKIYISTDNVTYTLKGTVTGATATYTATGLTADTLYYFYVVAYKGGSDSSSTNKIAVFQFDTTTWRSWHEPVDSDAVEAYSYGGNTYHHIWYDKITGKTTLGDEITTGNTVLYQVYEITKLATPNHFYTGCAIGQRFSKSGVALSETNAVKPVNGEHVAVTRPNDGAAPSNLPLVSGGFPVFDGANDELKGVTFAAQQDQPLTIFSVLKQITWTSNDQFWDGAASGYCWLNQQTSTPQIGMYAGSSSLVSGALALDTWGTVIAVYNGASSALYVNSEAAVTGNAGTRAYTGNTIGMQGSGGNKWGNVSFQFRIVYKGAASESLRNAMKTYMNSNFMPAGAPTLSAANYTSDKVNLTASVSAIDYDGIKWYNGAVLMGTTAYGVTSYQATGLDASTEYNFYCRTYKGAVEGTLSAAATITTYRAPLVYECDQSTLHQIRINKFTIVDGHTCILDWGDGTVVEIEGINQGYDSGGAYWNANLVHDYEEEGNYTIKLGGEIDYCYVLEIIGEVSPSSPFYDQKISFDWTDVVIPTSMIQWHQYNIDHGGVFSAEFPSTIRVFHIGRRSNDGNGCTGTMDFSTLPMECYDFHLENHPNLEADLETFAIPDEVTQGFHHVLFSNDETFSGDVSFLLIPETLTILRLDNTAIEGDMSGVEMPVCTSSGLDISASGTALTGVPRGAFETLVGFNFNDCALNQTEVDAVLAAIETRVASNEPVYNCTYNFAGAGNAAPSAAGVASRLAIIASYASAGKTATITVN